ncbi:retrovirus-related Pol polyprotein from transposon 17.6, partial [Trichonephila clavipes]
MRECHARVNRCLPLDESSRFCGLRQDRMKGEHLRVRHVTQIKSSTFIAEQQKSKELAPIIELVEKGNEADYGIKNRILECLKIDRFLRHFFWPKCYQEIEDFVKACDPCQRVGKINDKKKASLVTVPVISEVFSKINVDACGPMPISTEGNKYLITVMCLAPKYPDAIPVPDITSKYVANALLQVWHKGFPEFGLPPPKQPSGAFPPNSKTGFK